MDAVMAKREARTPRTFIGRSRSVSSEQKAIFHQVTGAGRSRVRRPFFDIGQSDAQACSEALEKLIADRIGAERT
jgi:hypothetical protein